MPVAFVDLQESLVAMQPVHAPLGNELEAVAERIIPRCPSGAVFRPRGDAEVEKSDVVLVNQADRGLGPLAWFVEKAEKLGVVVPIPAGVVHMLKLLGFNLLGDLVEGGENLRIRRALVAKIFLERQREAADAGEDFQPREEEPARGAKDADLPVA